MRVLEGEELEGAMINMALAAEQAGDSLCLNAHCGAIIVNEGIVIGRGYNAPPRDNPLWRRCLQVRTPPPGYKHDLTCCVHAEVRAGQDALIHYPHLIRGSTLYFTRVDMEGNILRSGKPYCTICSRFSLDIRVDYFVLWHEEGMTEYNTREYDNLSYAAGTR